MSNSPKYQLRIYQDADGKQPFQEWLKSLKDRKAANHILRRLQTVASGSLGDFKSLQSQDGLFEIRIHQGPGYRVYCGIWEQTIIILLCGGDKSTQNKDIGKAGDYRDDILRRGYSVSSV